MKKKTLRSSTIAFALGAILLSCNTPTENIEKAKANLTAANKNLNDSKETYLKDIEIYRTETNKKIAINNLSIIDFKERIEKDKINSNADYYRKIGDLERKNKEMERRMESYTPNGKEKWEAFKFDFSLGLDKIGNSLKVLSTKI